MKELATKNSFVLFQKAFEKDKDVITIFFVIGAQEVESFKNYDVSILDINKDQIIFRVIGTPNQKQFNDVIEFFNQMY